MTLAKGKTDGALAVFGAGLTSSALPLNQLIPALQTAFSEGAEVPLRHHHEIPQKDGHDATLLLMPAWQNEGVLGVKIVTVFPGNTAKGLPGLHSTYLLSDATTGQHIAIIDGNQITVRRTVGVSALAASYLARENAETLLIVGSGRVASLTAEAFLEVRAIKHVDVWDIEPASAGRLVDLLRSRGISATVAEDLHVATGKADIISCATLSRQPLIEYRWVKPGTHIDLIGSFTPEMREADSECFQKGRVFIDTPDALKESGDLLTPLNEGVITSASIVGSLSDLCSGLAPGRQNADEITVFKAVGSGLADIAAGALAYRNLTAG